MNIRFQQCFLNDQSAFVTLLILFYALHELKNNASIAGRDKITMSIYSE